MKIVLFSRFPDNTQNPRGGVETATLGLVRGLKTFEGIDLHVVTLERQLKEVLIETKEGITIHRLPGTNWPMFLDLMIGPGRRQTDRYIEKLKPDIVHFQESYGLGISKGATPVVFTVHGFDSLNLGAERKKLWRIRSWIWKQVETIGLRRQECVVSISPYVRRHIENYVREGRIVDIDNAISVEFFNIARKEHPGRVFFAGWLNPRKNALGLIHAFAKVLQRGVPASLHIAGEANDPSYFEAIQASLRDWGIGSRVKLLGRLPQDKIRRELGEASIFVLPSKQENAPMAIAEAMAAGVPVIASNRCGMPYMLQEEITGYLVDPEDTDTLASRMIDLLTNDSRRRIMAAAARREALSRYHPEAVAGKTLSLYRSLLNAT